MTEESEPTKCQYCDEEFDSEHERGVHIAEEHTEPNRIPKKTKNRNKQPDQLTDRWTTGKATS